MNSNNTIGIEDISFYIPSTMMDLSELVLTRSHNSELYLRAIDATGQGQIRFPAPWEDPVTMAAEAARTLLQRHQDQDLSGLRYVTAGTETSVDFSKPLSSYVIGVLNKSGFSLPRELTTFQLQHACAAGTLCLLSVASMLQVSGSPEDWGLVLCSDIARYEADTSAEITQGAGAAALKVGRNPELINLDLEHSGYSSKDVDDFFRPLDSENAKVKGGYSMKCYMEALDGALQDYSQRLEVSPADVLNQLDYIVLHAPFYKMPFMALNRILKKYLGLNQEQAQQWMEHRGLPQALEPVRHIGNIYGGALYLVLGSLLQQQYRKLGDDIIGKNILLCSYGSGNTMALTRGTIAHGAPGVISSWGDRLWKPAQDSDVCTYNEWLFSKGAYDHNSGEMNSLPVPQESYYLGSIRQDGYRLYNYQASAEKKKADSSSRVASIG